MITYTYVAAGVRPLVSHAASLTGDLHMKCLVPATTSFQSSIRNTTPEFGLTSVLCLGNYSTNVKYKNIETTVCGVAGFQSQLAYIVRK